MSETTTPTVETPAPTAAPTEAAEVKRNRTYTWGVGRRKSAVARVRVAPGSGKIELNGRSLNEYLTNERDRKSIFGPLEVTNTGGSWTSSPAAPAAGRPAKPGPS